jgi:hypothetical protein
MDRKLAEDLIREDLPSRHGFRVLAVAEALLELCPNAGI